MSTPLGTVLEEAESKLTADLSQSTLDLCRSVLSSHPRFLRAYRLVAEALWAAGDVAGAIQVFRAILNADPEDLVARYGLALALEETDGDEAMAEMEKALALAPGNEEVQRALQRLYQGREKGPPPVVKPGGEALARLYGKGGLWHRALAEVKDLVAAQPSRLDLQLLLAEALWHNDQWNEAAEVCHAILSNWPYCLKANLMLGHIWLQEGRVEAAQALFRKAEELDPDSVMAGELFGDTGHDIVVRLLPSPRNGGTLSTGS